MKGNKNAAKNGVFEDLTGDSGNGNNNTEIN